MSGLSCCYRGAERQVLNGVDLTVPRGQIVAVLGASGCGKTTLLRMLAGLHRDITITAGRLKVATQSLDVVFQHPALLPWRSAADNVGLAALLHRTPGPRRQLALQALDRVGLGAAADKLPHQLSGGMKARVALARALMLSPQLLLLDEPFAAIDAITRSSLGQLLEQVWMDSEFAAVLVTHDVDEAVRRASRIVVMSPDGRITTEVGIDLPYPRSTVEQFDPSISTLVADLNRLLAEAAQPS
ncbi:MAG: ABC transporter ATP-binding protein [Mycobacteriales bacterium]